MLNINFSRPTGSLDHPFRVRFYDNVMDPELYARLLSQFPDIKYLNTYSAVGCKNRLCNRDDGFDLFMKAHPEWNKLHAWLRENFLGLCMKAVNPTLRKKAKIKFEFSALPGEGGGLKPHPDTAKKVATAVMFFESDWKDEWGGAFEALRHLTRPDDDFDGMRVDWSEVETILKVPVASNRILFMQRTKNSLHGVRPCTAPRFRRSITVNLVS